MIPPKRSAEFSAAMERVLAVYAEPYDPARPVICLDERPCVLHAEARAGLPARPAAGGHPGADRTRDSEYVRAGSCCLFAAFEPLRSWRRTWVTPQRRRRDFAAVVRDLVDERYADAELVRIVCGNLNTHDDASLYAAFESAEARRLAAKVEFVYTPRHGSWLNMVEYEFAAFVRQCLDDGRRRIGKIEELRAEATAWAETRNESGGTVEWHMTNEDARVKLKQLYPSTFA